MAQLPAERRFFSTTRGQVLTLLREAARTVEELRGELGLTENAVRHQLGLLERDGLVRQVARRPGVRRPAAVYGLTPEAERLFTKPYAPLLRLVLDSLAERLPAEEREEIARDVGRRLAREVLVAEGLAGTRGGRGTREARLERTVRLLAGVGGDFRAEQTDGRTVLRGSRCPVAVVRPAHREVCLLSESFLEGVLGLPVRQECGPGARPACAFVVGE